MHTSILKDFFVNLCVEVDEPHMYPAIDKSTVLFVVLVECIKRVCCAAVEITLKIDEQIL